jgi:hypothetical protein
MWNANVSELATRIVETQLEWLRAAGPVSVGVGAALAIAVGAAVGRLVWTVRQVSGPTSRG